MSAPNPIDAASETTARVRTYRRDVHHLYPISAGDLATIDAALDAVRQLEQAARAVLSLAIVSYDGDPWYAQCDGLDGEAIIQEAQAALALFPEKTA